MPRLFVSACAVSCRRSRSFPEISSASSEAVVMMPKPPTWMSARITPSPNPLQYVPVSTTAKPVTQTADVEVNRAVSTPAPVPSSAAGGSANSTAPSRITTANAVTTVRAGCPANSLSRTRAVRPVTPRPPATGIRSSRMPEMSGFSQSP
jgi:hypothetical protein